MRKLLLIAMLCGGCLSTAQPRAIAPIESDPIVGELGCAPPMSLLDALYRPVTAPAESCATQP